MDDCDIGLKNKILIVEDDKHTSTMFNQFLSAENYQSAIIDNCANAIEYLQNEKCDLVFLDLILEKGNGFEVLNYLRSEAKLKDIPVIIIIIIIISGQKNEDFIK